MTVHQFLERLAEAGLLHEFRGRADPDLQMAGVLAALDGEPVVFRRVRGHRIPVAGNLCGRPEMLALALGIEPANLVRALAAARNDPLTPPVVERPACQEVVERPASLDSLPVLRHRQDDGGPYVTSSACIVRHPEHGLNASYHRLMVLGPDRAAIRIVANRHTDQALKASDGEMDIAICIGAPVQAMVAAATSPPAGVFEMAVANALQETPLARCVESDLLVPADTEIVIEGRITRETAEEGPFLDLTLTRDVVRRQPVVKALAITRRRDAVYQALLPGLSDHRMLMGMPREADIYSEVSRACRCEDVAITPSGCSWLHAVVQVHKEKSSDGRDAIEAAFRAHPSLKQCIVVDEDIDPRDPAQVEWAVATRFQAATDLVVMRDRPSSSLDPSAEHPPGRKSIGSKMGLDATIKKPLKEPFLRLAYPPVGDDDLRQLRGDRM